MEARSVPDARNNSEDSAENDGGGGHVSSMVLVRGVPALRPLSLLSATMEGRGRRPRGLIARASRPRPHVEQRGCASWVALVARSRAPEATWTRGVEAARERPYICSWVCAAHSASGGVEGWRPRAQAGLKYHGWRPRPLVEQRACASSVATVASMLQPADDADNDAVRGGRVRGGGRSTGSIM